MRLRDTCASFVLAITGALAGFCISRNVVAAAVATPPVLIRGGFIITMDGDTPGARVIKDGAVLIRGGRIVWVGPDAEALVVAGATVVDATGKFVIPGLIDAHVHLFDESQHDLYVANGVTSVFNMSGTPRILEWQEEIHIGQRSGPTLFTTGPQIKDEPLPIYDGVIAIRAASEAEALVAIHEQMGYTRLKIWSSLRPDIYDAITRAARDRGLAITGHVPSRVGLRGALASGHESVAHLEELLNKFFLHDTDADGLENAAMMLREHGVPVITTLITYEMIVDTGDDESLANRLARDENRYIDPVLLALWQPHRNEYRRLRDRRAQFERGLAFQKMVAGVLRDHGVPLIAGSDAGLFMPNVLPGVSLHRELELLVESGLTPVESLQAATSAAGDYLDPGSGRGRIRVGAPADLVVLNGNPLRSIGATQMIDSVILRGAVYSRVTLDKLLAGLAARQERARPVVEKLLAASSLGELKAVLAPVEADGPSAALSETSLLTAAYLFAQEDRIDEADAIAQLARRLHPHSYLPAYFHAGLLQMAGRSDDARTAMQAMFEIAPNHAQARRALQSQTDGN